MLSCFLNLEFFILFRPLTENVEIVTVDCKYSHVNNILAFMQNYDNYIVIQVYGNYVIIIIITIFNRLLLTISMHRLQQG